MTAIILHFSRPHNRVNNMSTDLQITPAAIWLVFLILELFTDFVTLTNVSCHILWKPITATRLACEINCWNRFFGHTLGRMPPECVRSSH
jgi:hypothetical protein